MRRTLEQEYVDTAQEAFEYETMDNTLANQAVAVADGAPAGFDDSEGLSSAYRRPPRRQKTDSQKAEIKRWLKPPHRPSPPDGAPVRLSRTLGRSPL